MRKIHKDVVIYEEEKEEPKPYPLSLPLPSMRRNRRWELFFLIIFKPYSPLFISKPFFPQRKAGIKEKKCNFFAETQKSKMVVWSLELQRRELVCVFTNYEDANWQKRGGFMLHFTINSKNYRVKSIFSLRKWLFS